MATDPIEQILATIIKADGLDLAANADHRLQASFVWNRANSLQSSEGLPVATLSARVQSEYELLKEFIDMKLGADRISGPLVPVRGGSGDVSPPHLDLRDLTKQLVSDLGADANSVRGLKLDALAHDATDMRERRVLAIVWRAGYLVPELWTPSPDHLSATLNQPALDELLDRRLRACERMTYNVSGQQAMLGVGETEDIPRGKWNLSDATPTSHWLDGLRVRLFEYPFVPNYFKSVVGPTLGTTWFEQKGSVPGGGSARLAYTVKPIGSRAYTDQSVDPVQSTTAWRIPPSNAGNWRVSPGDDAGFGLATTPPLTGIVPFSYRIDFVPTGNAVDAIDAMFDYTSTTGGGAPLRADFFNRSWMFCDHVIALLCLEAFLFARRRRPGANATAEFSALVARRPQVTVASLPQGSPKTVSTAYVCLDGQVALNPDVVGQFQVTPKHVTDASP